ncbi:protein ABSCISIC ACID-INSENSITIVE 5-like [Quillaja saponaria]|uniref:Protein ABSCISIC ACID-INSENSITIVE 5-like n=1 Tax=Quillaja saponaria TaxID=32244 RepID=A0AAD7Q761_QUISA|nr:protein ABSCISIC ACID-INSENSITIVE 5-like [Quillaja saponaria]KAJ7976116.1 protein ABSCISIC ACID-INSENSITIVE 5-like [Quillaja saponaria]
MVLPESEMMTEGEVELPLQGDQQPQNHPISNLGRQSSIYSLTLDEFQHTLCESGKNFGSMNMDEFLTSIWNAEENQAVNSTNNHNNNHHSSSHHNNNSHFPFTETMGSKGITKQPSLPRQGSLTLPAPLCRKTVDEVWSEIHKGQGQQRQTSTNNDNNHNHSNNNNVQNTESIPRQPTFGEMTLEDFLIKAGVVREAGSMPMPVSQQQQHYGLYRNNNQAIQPSIITSRPVIVGGGGVTGSAGTNVVAPYQAVPQTGGGIGETSGYVGNGKRDSGYPPPQPPPAVCYGGRMVNGGGGYGAAASAIGMAAPVSPVSSDGMCTNQVDSSGNQFGLSMGALTGRKRIIDGPVEKVVERRQRRMIKNRESAARSRARKQAYTVELEAELNQLREENAQLKHALTELERKRKQQYFEEAKMKAQTKAQKAKEKLRVLRRSRSCPL